MDFIYEEDIPRLQGSKQAGEIPWTVEHRTGGNLHIHPHLIGYDMCQGSLSQTGRTMEKGMVQGLPAEFCSLDINPEIGDYFSLSSKIFQLPGADNSVQFLIFAFVCIVGVEIRHLSRF